MLPRAPVRQWVLSLPFELRCRLAWDHELCRTGTVTVIQRFGGALNLNVHFHTLAVDVYYGRHPEVLSERDKIKKLTMLRRKKAYRAATAA